jgi:hypothetical protein
MLGKVGRNARTKEILFRFDLRDEKPLRVD